MQQLVADGSRLNVQFDAHEFALPEAERARMTNGLEALGRHAAAFPVADLHVYLEYNRHSRHYAVKLTLILPGTTLSVREDMEQIHPAFDKALAVLHDRLTAYKAQMGGEPQRQHAEKGTAHTVEAAGGLDAGALTAAAEAGDYAAFRVAALPYEEALRKKAGRWVERYPEVNGRIGRGLEINDVVEGVFLAAFERFDSRPADLRFGDWLDGLIDEEVRELRDRPDKELENIGLARSAVEAQGGPALG